jgi:glycosyltransferase involved in cell wall biosynthesis
MIKLKIIIPFYNVEKWIQLNIESILSQTYKNYECFYVDDMSTDNSSSIIQAYKNEKIHLIKNTQKKYALHNIYDAILFSQPHDEDVIVIIDGDDWLADQNVFEKLNDAYTKGDILLTYGNYIEYPSGNRPWNVVPYSKEVINTNSYRDDVWRASHLRTFKYTLWKKVKQEDLKDSNGNFYRMAWDLAIMFPMLEMSGGKFKSFKDIMYCYNVNNPINDHKTDHRLQLSLDKEIRNKQKYKSI